jgi:two-component system chemotaxis response regulator CheY
LIDFCQILRIQGREADFMITNSTTSLPLPMHGLEHLRVLLLDDSEHMRRLLRGFLAALGTREVRSPEDVEQAYPLIREGWPELIITDLKMRPVDGFEFMKTVRKSDKGAEIPIIVVTGHADLPTIEKLMMAGATSVLVKPVSLDVLRVQVLSQVGLIQEQRRAACAPSIRGFERKEAS